MRTDLSWLVGFGIFSLVWITGLSYGQKCPPRLVIRSQVQQAVDLNLPQEKLDALKKIEKTCLTCGYADDSVYVKILKNIGSAYLFLGKDSSAYQSIQKALKIALTNGPKMLRSDQANLYYYIGLLENIFKNYQSALDALDKATRIGKQYNQLQEVWPFAYRLQIEIYYYQGDYERAFDKAIQSELVNRAASKPMYVAQSLAYQGLIYTDYREFALAEKKLAEAVGILQRLAIDNPNRVQYDLATYLTWLANTQRLTGRHQQALENYQRAKTMINGYNDAIADIEASMGQIIAENLHEPNQAMAYFDQALKRTTDVYLRARILDYRGRAYQLKGQYRVALQHYQTALNGFSFGPHSGTISKNPSSEAIRQAAKKEYVFSIIQHKADAWLDWALHTNNRFYFRQALATYRLADRMIDYMRWEYIGQHSKLYWRQKTRNLYEQAILACSKLNDANQAYYFFEKSRAVLLADKLNELGARRQLSTEQTWQESRIKQRIIDLQDQLIQLKPTDSGFASVQNGLIVEQERLDSLVKVLEKLNPDYYRYKYANEVMPVADVQVWLRQHKMALVTYFVGDSTLYVLGITPDKVEFHNEPANTYRSLTDEYMQLLANGGAINANFKRFLNVSNGLYNQLIAPLKLPMGRVVVSPDGVFIPFEALSRSANTPDYLLADCAFSYTYSAQILLKERPEETTHERDFLGMAPVDFTNQLSLSGSDQALRTIGQHFFSPTVLTKQSATRGAFQSLAPATRVVQLFTHADADSVNQEPLLYFADSTLKLSDITRDQAFQTRLLVLAACKTGIGKNRKGEGVFSLARGFAELDIPSVVTTLWSIENQPTYRITDLFYQQLLNGLPKDVALQQAKLEFYRTASRSDQLPSQWAGLILIGKADPLLNSWKWIWLFGGAGVVVCMVLGWKWWRGKGSTVTKERLNEST